MATITIPISIASALPYGTSPPEWVHVDGTNSPVRGWAFDAAAIEQAFFQFVALGYGSGNLTVKLWWYAAATTGNARLGCAIGAVSDADSQDLETDGLGTEATTDDAASGTSQGPTVTSVTVSSLDSLAADDLVTLAVRRVASHANDTMAGDLFLVAATVSYSDS